MNSTSFDRIVTLPEFTPNASGINQKGAKSKSANVKRREEAQLHDQTWANPRQHRGPGPAGKLPHEG
jgi:hypothetical protein